MSTKTDRQIMLTLGGIILTFAIGIFYMATQTKPADVYQLVSSETHLQETLDAMGIAVLEADNKGIITKWDAVAASLWGYRASEVIGKPVEFLMVEEVRANHEQAFSQAVNKEYHPRVARCNYAKKKDGTTFLVHLNVRVLPNGQGVAALLQEVEEDE